MKQHMSVYVYIYIIIYYYIHVQYIHIITYITSMAGQAECCYLGVKNMGIPGRSVPGSIYVFDI